MSASATAGKPQSATAAKMSRRAFVFVRFLAVCGADFVFRVVMSVVYSCGFCRAQGFIKSAKELQAFWKNFGGYERNRPGIDVKSRWDFLLRAYQEHRLVACAPSAFETRCAPSSRAQFRWARRPGGLCSGTHCGCPSSLADNASLLPRWIPSRR